MNKKITNLINQAISDVDYIHFDNDIDEELAQMYIPDVFAERFAELIVRECAAFLCLGGGDGHEDGERLKRHFGIEEK